jgi:hypothetical protein
MATSTAVAIVATVADALHAAHTLVGRDGSPLEIIHRDVGPSNILLSEHGHVKLIDFGIAKAEGRLTSTAVGIRKGRLRYMPPEQAIGGKVDARGDIHSLAAVLWEMLTLRNVRNGKDEISLIRELLQGPPPRLRTLVDVPPALEALVDEALSTNPHNRPASAGVFRKRLLEAVPEARLVEREELAQLVREARPASAQGGADDARSLMMTSSTFDSPDRAYHSEATFAETEGVSLFDTTIRHTPGWVERLLRRARNLLARIARLRRRRIALEVAVLGACALLAAARTEWADPSTSRDGLVGVAPSEVNPTSERDKQRSGAGHPASVPPSSDPAPKPLNEPAQPVNNVAAGVDPYSIEEGEAGIEPASDPSAPPSTSASAVLAAPVQIHLEAVQPRPSSNGPVGTIRHRGPVSAIVARDSKPSTPAPDTLDLPLVEHVDLVGGPEPLD